MNKQNNTIKSEKNQEFLEFVKVKILYKLPVGLEETSKTSGAIERKREIKSGSELILVLLIYALTDISQRILAAFAGVMGIADISDQAWQKKMLKCATWLAGILNEVLPKSRCSTEAASIKNRAIELVDSSCVKQEGKKGATIRVHMCYSLSRRHMNEVSVTDNKTAESFKPFNINPGSIYLADAGYGKGKNLEYITSRKADAVFRMTPNNVSLASDPYGKEKIDMVKKLDTDENIVEFYCYIHTEKGKYIPVRIIASRLPEDKIAQSVKRKKRRAQINQSTLKTETLVYAHWVILMTSLDESYSAEEILKLYRMRWQIELLFKRIKQFFKVTRIRAATIKHSKVLILLWLIAWTLTERETIAAEIFLLSKNPDFDVYSSWTMCGFFFHSFKALIYCLLADIEKADLEHIFKRLKNHKDDRGNQLAAFFP